MSMIEGGPCEGLIARRWLVQYQQRGSRKEVFFLLKTSFTFGKQAFISSQRNISY